MAISRTYWCGYRGRVRRLDNFTFPWFTVSVPNQNITLNDIKTDPTDNLKVFTVGDFNTIYVSADGGINWTLAAGLAAYPNVEWHEVWPIDPLNSVVVGSQGIVAFSSDGGVNFTVPNPTAFPIGGSVRAVHFLTPLIGVIGYEDKVFRTIDGGLTWISCNSGLGLASTVPGVTAQINGIHVDQANQVIIVHGNTNIWRSTDNGLTFIVVYTYVHTIFIGNQNLFISNGRHLTWFSDNELWGVGDYNEITRSINGGASWILAKTGYPTFSRDGAGHFYTTKDGFFNITENLYSTVDADVNVNGVFSDTSGFIEFPVNAVWTGVPGPCYNLIACGGRPIPLTVDNDLSLLVGQVVMVDGDCYTVQLAQSCQGAITITTPITSFLDCCSCNPPTCYELRDCTGLTPVIITNTNLANYVGQTVKVCEFTASPVIQIPGSSVFCTNLDEKGFVTQITGSTTGFYYESSSGLTKPYTNPLLFPLSLSDQICVNPVSPFDVTSTQPGTWTIQFFIGTTPITNPIIISTVMPIPTVQFFINQQIIYPNTTITVNTFDNFNFLNVTIIITAPVDETQITVTAVEASSGTTLTVIENFSGDCICYTVLDIGPGCNCTAPFLGTISGVFPDCECCLPPPPPEPEPPYEPTIPEIDKHTYRVCESQCDIDANKVYANAMYDQFKTDAYGMENCCPKNINQIWIAKELSDLSKIKC